MKSKISALGKDVSGISQKLFLWLYLFTIVTHVYIYLSEIDGAMKLTSLVMISSFTAALFFDYLFPSGKRRSYFVILIILFFLPVRLYVFGQVPSPPMFYYFLLCSIGPYFLSRNAAIALVSASIIEVVGVFAIFKVQSWFPFVYLPVSKIEMGSMYGWVVVLIFTTVVVFRINEYRKQSEKMLLRQVEKDMRNAQLTSLGEMAGSIAHEINNPLQIISGHIESISSKLAKVSASQMDSSSNESIRHHLERATATTFRISRVTQSMLNMSRIPDSADLREETVYSCFDLVRGILENKMEQDGVAHRFDPDQLMLTGLVDPQSLAQVLMQLYSNSMEAIRELDEKWIQLEVRLENKDLLIRMTDSGQEIPRLVAERIFDPFFTTKIKGEKMGLGLSIAKKIVQNMTGDLTYLPNNGKTSFLIRLKSGLSSV